MIDLQVLQNYYEQNLLDKIFRYTLANVKIIEVRFFLEAFCHLLGIQHVTKNRQYIGKSGYERIKSGELSIKLLRKINRIGFDKIKRRIECFSLLYSLMERGDVFRFYSQRVRNTRIQASFVIYEKERELYLHLFLAKESPKSNIYAPMSYIVLTERDDNPNLYISGQEHKKIVAVEIITVKMRGESS